MKLVKTTLTGIGQIFLRESALSGLLIVAGMFFSHWALGVSCFLGSLTGTLTARILKFPDPAVRQGLYGFNASLAYMCTLFTFGLAGSAGLLVWILGAAAAVAATLITHVCIARNKTAFTFPFVLTCWIFCWGVAQLGLFGLSQTTPSLPDYTHASDTLVMPFFAWAEVNFGSSLLTGLFLFAAIAAHSPTAAMWATAAAPISAIIAQSLFHIEDNTLANGLYSFSSILIACAFAGSRFVDFIYVIAGLFLAVCIQYAVSLTGLPPYTIGFIAAGWILLAVKGKAERHFVPPDPVFKSLPHH